MIDAVGGCPPGCGGANCQPGFEEELLPLVSDELDRREEWRVTEVNGRMVVSAMIPEIEVLASAIDLSFQVTVFHLHQATKDLNDAQVEMLRENHFNNRIFANESIPELVQTVMERLARLRYLRRYED